LDESIPQEYKVPVQWKNLGLSSFNSVSHINFSRLNLHSSTPSSSSSFVRLQFSVSFLFAVTIYQDAPLPEKFQLHIQWDWLSCHGFSYSRIFLE
jgi:hypothetical protein